jgi:hypothetical protein
LTREKAKGSSGNNTHVNMHESGIPFEPEGLMDKYKGKY